MSDAVWITMMVGGTIGTVFRFWPNKSPKNAAEHNKKEIAQMVTRNNADPLRKNGFQHARIIPEPVMETIVKTKPKFAFSKFPEHHGSDISAAQWGQIISSIDEQKSQERERQIREQPSDYDRMMGAILDQRQMINALIEERYVEPPRPKTTLKSILSNVVGVIAVADILYGAHHDRKNRRR